MNKDEEAIFEETVCLTEQQLENYLRGTLSEAEMHAIEVHLSCCEFCNEALEGLSNVTHQEEIPIIVKQIRSRFKHELRAHHSKNKKIKLYIWLSVVVLCILIILLIAYFAINYTMKKEQQHKPPQTEIPVRQ